MSTPRNTHIKLQELSSRLSTSRTPMNINDVAAEVGLHIDEVASHIDTLRSLGLVETDHTNEMITLTDSGRQAPL
jgi:predicted transcriptional regulator